MGYARLVSFCQLRLMSHELPGNFPHQHMLGPPLPVLVQAQSHAPGWPKAPCACVSPLNPQHRCSAITAEHADAFVERGHAPKLQSSSMTSFVEAACQHVQTQARSSCVKNPEARASPCDCGYHA